MLGHLEPGFLLRDFGRYFTIEGSNNLERLSRVLYDLRCVNFHDNDSHWYHTNSQTQTSMVFKIVLLMNVFSQDPIYKHRCEPYRVT